MDGPVNSVGGGKKSTISQPCDFLGVPAALGRGLTKDLGNLRFIALQSIAELTKNTLKTTSNHRKPTG